VADDDRSDAVIKLIEAGRDREAARGGLADRAARGLHRPPSPDRSTQMTATAAQTTVDLEAVKSRQQQTWSSGDYAMIGTTLQIVGESLCEALDVAAGSRVLDVAAGNGNAALAAARRGCDVTATDYVEALLDRARRRADADGLPLETRVADAENLPFDDASFDCVLSTFGVMFTPDQERAAAELLRVCRPGGRIGLANWTPDGFVGRMFKIVGQHVPPPAGVPSPLAWGTEDRLDALFGHDARVEVGRRQFTFRFRSASDWFDTFTTYYGPLLRACDALDPAGRESLRSQLVALAEDANRDTRGALTVPSDYLEVTMTRR
jgi:SAM-dependent methyltransferase